jgi:hypothetical protein
LVDPAIAVVDPSTVCGKTTIVTVGIVFSNSGESAAFAYEIFNTPLELPYP